MPLPTVNRTTVLSASYHSAQCHQHTPKPSTLHLVTKCTTSTVRTSISLKLCTQIPMTITHIWLQILSMTIKISLHNNVTITRIRARVAHSSLAGQCRQHEAHSSNSKFTAHNNPRLTSGAHISQDPTGVGCNVCISLRLLHHRENEGHAILLVEGSQFVT